MFSAGWRSIGAGEPKAWEPETRRRLVPACRTCARVVMARACLLVARSPRLSVTLPQASSPSRLNLAGAAPDGRGGLDGSPSACGVTGREPGGTRPRPPGGPHCRMRALTHRRLGSSEARHERGRLLK
jgi:hypothetical protein